MCDRRMNLIFNNENMEKVEITILQMLGICGVALLVDCFLLIAWEFTAGTVHCLLTMLIIYFKISTDCALFFGYMYRALGCCWCCC